MSRPEDVFIVRPNGNKIPCELAPYGESDGIEYWSVATEMDVGDQIHIGFMPACTSLLIPIADDVEEAQRLQ